jgi:hypothetical protein
MPAKHNNNKEGGINQIRNYLLLSGILRRAGIKIKILLLLFDNNRKRPNAAPGFKKVIMKSSTLSKNKSQGYTVTDIIASLFLLLFAYNILSICLYQGFASLKNCLAFYTNQTTLFATIILIFQIGVALLLFIPRTRILGCYLVMAYPILTVAALWSFPLYPHDFGGLINKLNKPQRWMFLMLLFILSAVPIIRSWRRSPRPVETNDPPIVYT